MTGDRTEGQKERMVLIELFYYEFIREATAGKEKRYSGNGRKQRNEWMYCLEGENGL